MCVGKNTFQHSSTAAIHRLSFVPLLTPTTTEARLEHLCKCADSFLYCVRYAARCIASSIELAILILNQVTLNSVTNLAMQCKPADPMLLARCRSLTGVTGERHSVSADLPKFIGRVRQHTKLPLAIGFGVC